MADTPVEKFNWDPYIKWALGVAFIILSTLLNRWLGPTTVIPPIPVPPSVQEIRDVVKEEVKTINLYKETPTKIGVKP